MRSVKTTLAAAVLALSAAAAHSETINFNTWVPANDLAVKQGLEPYFKAVDEQTDGRLKVNLFTAGQMAGPMETLGAIRDGAFHAGFVFEQFFPKELKYTALFADVPAISNDSVAAIGAALETFYLDCPECQDEMADANLFALGGHATAPYILMCAKPVSALADLKGSRIRIATPIMAAIVNALGANGVNISFIEMTQALERGAVDCVISPEAWLTSFGITEIIKTSIPEPNFGPLSTVGFVTFSKSAWEALEQDARDALIRNMPDYVANVTIGFLEERATSADAGKKAGMKEVALDDAFMAAYQSFRNAEDDRIIAAGKARGAENIEAVLEKYKANYGKWEAIAAEVGTDRKALSARLWDEIYSKLEY